IFLALIMTACVALYIGAGIFFSARAKNQMSATSQTFMLILWHTLGWPILYTICRNWRTPEARELAESIAFFSPVLAILEEGRCWTRGAELPEAILQHCVVILIVAVVFFHLAHKRIERLDE
ncbi:MAG: hypothetical protein ABIH23_03830, partial [bacterium]